VGLAGSSIGSTVWAVVRIALVAYVVVVVLAVLLQSYLLYFPERRIEATPQLIGLSFEDVTFAASDGTALSGWFVPAEDPCGVVLLCHGNAGNISHRLDSIAVFHRVGLSTFIFDYRGYGKSDGRISEKGTYRDAEGAWNYLVQNQHVSPSDIIVFGRSLGGAIAAWLAGKHIPKSVIIESTFTSIPDLAADLYPYLPVRLLSRFKYTTSAYIAHVACPLLIIHSRDDDIIPFKHGRRLFEAAREPKEFLEIRGSHNDGFLVSGTLYTAGLQSFISKPIQR